MVRTVVPATPSALWRFIGPVALAMAGRTSRDWGLARSGSGFAGEQAGSRFDLARSDSRVQSSLEVEVVGTRLVSAMLAGCWIR